MPKPEICGPNKETLVKLWITEHFPNARIEPQGPTADTKAWLLVNEGDLQAELDLDRTNTVPPIKTLDYFFAYALTPPNKSNVLTKAHISDPEYFNKLHKTLEAGGFTPRERQNA